MPYLTKKVKRPRVWLGLSIFCLLAYATLHVLPGRHLRIAAGPVGGSFYETALQYKKSVERAGYRVDIVPFQNTDEIGADVADDGQHLDLGFVAQDLSDATGEKLVSLGDIQLQPIFIFQTRDSAAARPIQSFADLRGMSLVLPPERSLTSRTLLSIFALSGIDKQNTPIHFLPLDQGMARLQHGEFDVGLFILAADSPLMARLAADPSLLLVQTAQQNAIAKKLSYLRVVTLPAGIFDLAHRLPERDLEMLASTISVVALREMPPATQYAFLEAMREAHRKGSYVSRSGEFPRYSENVGDAESLVDDFYRNGTPWTYAHFSVWVASVIDTYLAPLLAVWFATSALSAISELEKVRLILLLAFAKTMLWWVNRRGKKGIVPSPRILALIRGIEATIAREERGTHRLLSELRRIRQR